MKVIQKAAQAAEKRPLAASIVSLLTIITAMLGGAYGINPADQKDSSDPITVTQYVELNEKCHQLLRHLNNTRVHHNQDPVFFHDSTKLRFR